LVLLPGLFAMTLLDTGTVVRLVLLGVALFLPAWGLARLRRHRRLVRQAAAAAPGAPAAAAPRGWLFGRRRRMRALESAQAELASRLESLSAVRTEPEERLRELAGQLLALHRDKNASFEAAIAKLRAHKDTELASVLERLAPLETQIAAVRAETGAAAEIGSRLEALAGRKDSEATALLARLEERLEAVRGRVESLEGPGSVAATTALAELAGQLAGLHARNDTGLAAVLGRLTPLESRLDALDWAQDELAEHVAHPPAPARPPAGAAGRLAVVEGRTRRPAPRPRTGDPAGGDMEEVWSLPQLVSLHSR
jgi:hypothetical protein